MVWQDVLHGPAVATGTTVTSANSLFGAGNVTAAGVPVPNMLLTLPWIPRIIKLNFANGMYVCNWQLMVKKPPTMVFKLYHQLSKNLPTYKHSCCNSS